MGSSGTCNCAISSMIVLMLGAVSGAHIRSVLGRKRESMHRIIAIKEKMLLASNRKEMAVVNAQEGPLPATLPCSCHLLLVALAVLCLVYVYLSLF